MLRSRIMVCAASFAALVTISTMQAQAACTRLAFSVNDYGKEGPTKDAKELLDKYIKKWTSERGIKTYTTGPKSVECELFLNFIVFDEHTCKASASVCWNGPPAKSAADGAVPSASGAKAAPKNSERRAPATATAKVKSPVVTTVTTGSVKPAPATAKPQAPVPPAPEPAAAEQANDAATAPAPILVPPLPPAKGGD